ncbi:hypothetical protein Ddc_18445 [Ditylenchus destructor]|nr:hypothetical protein Ddc_18445 [Ditylenchus destructor]
MGSHLSMRRPSKKYIAKSSTKAKLLSGSKIIIDENPPKYSMKIGQVKLQREWLLEALKYFSRKRLFELKLVTHLFTLSCESLVLKAVHIISSLEVPGIHDHRLLPGNLPENDHRSENQPFNRYQPMSEERLEYYVGFNRNGYPSFSVFDRPPSRHIRFRYVKLRIMDYRKLMGLMQ